MDDSISAAHAHATTKLDELVGLQCAYGENRHKVIIPRHENHTYRRNLDDHYSPSVYQSVKHMGAAVMS